MSNHTLSYITPPLSLAVCVGWVTSSYLTGGTWPSATAPFYQHTVSAIAFSFKASITCSIKGSVPITW